MARHELPADRGDGHEKGRYTHGNTKPIEESSPDKRSKDDRGDDDSDRNDDQR
ncbi:hypothetical protein [Amycolatopsis cihanbeyliensis]|uniref:Uncharacterized protein n=1 Tax=Amycolatopsis cihanbeyliensis TaxID=1128664 RepID=A0A542CTQ8_AMYCI|nr:hypothetical protein [Amycolatopsis cihanbeyliensis]TQI94201.1 hypothetical protein FB471_6359 [Amycolatopsis cihanbeyliensis]